MAFPEPLDPGKGDHRRIVRAKGQGRRKKAKTMQGGDCLKPCANGLICRNSTRNGQGRRLG